jgi:dephospho-CoA kinase
MPLIYVTGIETAGKTTACQELKIRGFEAYDIDKGIAHYYNKTTGTRSEWLSSAEARSEDWHNQNDYIMDRAHVERLAEQAQTKPIILCGTTQNDEAVLDLFDKVIYLSLDEATLKQRMAARQPNEFAFAENEKQAILSWHKSSEEAYRKRGATMIDASQPVEQVTKQILAAIQ